MTDLLDSVIVIHKLVCHISVQNGTSEMVALWAKAFRRRENYQTIIQLFSVTVFRAQSFKETAQLFHPTLSCLTSSLDKALQPPGASSTLVFPNIAAWNHLLKRMTLVQTATS